jgi:ABC-type antimicrobial peptide transport system permease subunit
VNPDLPLGTVRTMQEVAEKSMARTSFTLVMLSIAGAMALLLGVAGLYGVISYAVSQRSREIGIRMALGAQPSRVAARIVGQGLLLVGAGLAVGLAVTLALSRFTASFLYGIVPTDPVTFVGVPALLIATFLAAMLLPARRASRIEPMTALRNE